MTGIDGGRAPEADGRMGTARWLAVGRSDHPDARTAGAAAVAEAITGDDPKLLIVFCAATYDPEEVLAGITAASGGVPLIGCSAYGEFASDGPTNGRVLVTALGGPGFTVTTAVGMDVTADQRTAGAAAAAGVAHLDDPPHCVLMLLTDGFSPDQEEIISGAYSVVGASVPLIGGAASPGRDLRRIFMFHGDKVYDDAVVGAAIGSPAPFGIGIKHGYRRVGEAMLVTRSDKGLVYELDGKPAVPTYLRRLDAPEATYTDPAAFNLFARSRPIGVRRRSGEDVRNVGSTAHLAEGWLYSGGEIPEGGMVWPMEGDKDSMLDAADEACRAAVDALGGRRPIGLLAFDCVSRSGLMGEDGHHIKVRRMCRQADGAPLAGLYTWGEIGRTRGIHGLHHHTVVVLAVS